MVIEPSQLVHQFQVARRDTNVAVLEGFHPLKHALRFGAVVETVVTSQPKLLEELCASLAPDVSQQIQSLAVEVDEATFRRLAPLPPRTGVISLARRRSVDVKQILLAERKSPLLVLERPADLGNIGAAIRVAAGAGACGVITTGPHDPWHAAVIRGAAGLQYALPVGRIDALPEVNGPLLAVHPKGEMLAPGLIPANAVLVFGSERRGLSDAMLSRVERPIAIPMEPGVSSLNLATSVAIMLYTWRLWQDSGSNRYEEVRS